MLETVIKSYYRGTTQIDKCPLFHVRCHTCRIGNGLGSRWRLLSDFLLGHPRKSIQQILPYCITPPAALCDIRINLLLFLIGFSLFVYFKPFFSICQSQYFEALSDAVCNPYHTVRPMPRNPVNDSYESGAKVHVPQHNPSAPVANNADDNWNWDFLYCCSFPSVLSGSGLQPVRTSLRSLVHNTSAAA